METDVANFAEDVIETSRTTPVLVDFWAPWCGPCRTLGPILDRLAGESEGKWRLVKINTDQNPDISREYGIRGIPAVKLFADGVVIDEFTGVLPEYAVKQWLEKALPSENKKRLDRAEMEIGAGNGEAAEALLNDILDEEPGNPKARVLLAQLLAFRDPARAAELVAGTAFAGPGFIQTEEAIQTIARLFDLDPSSLPDGPARAAYADALGALVERDFELAVERFIDVIQIDRYYDDDGARKACVALFTLLGNDHPSVKQHRRRFDMALY